MTNVWYYPPTGHVVMEADFPAQHWALQLIADFSVLQSTIEMAVGQKFAMETPAIAKVLRKRFLGRLTDDDRWSLVKALGDDTQYEGGLSAASEAFWQAKRVRDLFAHHSNMSLVREPQSTEYFYQVHGGIATGIPSPLTPSAVRQLSANCRWLSALVKHLAYLSGVEFASFAIAQREDGFLYAPKLEILAPPPLPVPPDWEAHDLAREAGESSLPVQQEADYVGRDDPPE